MKAGVRGKGGRKTEREEEEGRGVPGSGLPNCDTCGAPLSKVRTPQPRRLGRYL